LTYVLIGASGHLGGTLISLLLAAGNPIRAFDFKFPKEKIESPLLRYYLGDVTKPETLKETFSGLEPHSFCVIHLAALINIQANRPNPAMLSVNVEGVKNVFREFEEKRGARFIYVSSVDAFLQTRSLVNEASPLVSDFEHAAGYPATKAMATDFIKEKIQSGADAVVVYPAGIIGPGDDGHNHLVQLLRDYLLGKIPGVVPQGYDIVDVRDVAQAMITLAEGEKKGDSFILSGHEISLKNFLLLAKKWNGGKGRHVAVFPFFLAYLGLPFIKLSAKITHTRPLYTRFAISVIRHANSFDRTAAKKAFDYNPRSLEESVKDTLDYLREKTGLPPKRKSLLSGRFC